ncbi:ABSCISIC ACID-INSENSITIVE 5-like protein 1 [Punica granatum]|uniref:ABSCISIC ACID-INSENSITIVE 5-like protein 1 n=2 Tax=Punica granatum TaxID=22663 RepID=A0A6P8D7Z1_PUNGR|nr:ABSCISIC ACID-INSENSITIVE 5-like protein 1 [Punica granatum]XP_031387423.1 ABSCISIC ACID-INSENSITIVE 5-like protein 1 [Punica granatum]XP_031387424.1 ABSCISIC ACID-INSENSITIVE 5-like protein 1 [Punica granatum]PKI53683.1 hypothetical protein CRG98_025924 [Punica granatum]
MTSESENSVSLGNLKLALVPMPPPSDSAEPLQPKDQTVPSPGQQQSSILSLTLNEIQCKSGKSFGSMSMDEFLASIWSVDEGTSASASLSFPRNDPPEDSHKPAAATGPGSLLRQASFSIPTLLCNKTVDEVWFEIHKDQQDKQLPGPGPSNLSNRAPPRRQPTLGEMTLEDFLVKAGVVQEPATLPSQSKNLTALAFLKPPPGFMDSAPSFNPSYGTRNLAGFGLISNSHGSGNNLSGNGITGNYPLIFGNNGNRCAGESSCNVLNENCHGLAEAMGLKRRIIEGPPEVVVERRQRRMIKNRESAARSRARKQAYTVELEVELNQLREENERLKRIVAETDGKRQKEVMRRRQPIRAVNAADQLRAIRRTVSMAW